MKGAWNERVQKNLINSFMMGGRYHIETSPLICRANQWTGFYMITVSVMKELTHFSHFFVSITPESIRKPKVY